MRFELDQGERPESRTSFNLGWQLAGLRIQEVAFTILVIVGGFMWFFKADVEGVYHRPGLSSACGNAASNPIFAYF